MSKYVDTSAVVQVLGNLFKNPEIFEENERYNFNVDDFPEKLHKVLFESFYNLYQLGAKVLNVITIEDYLANSPTKNNIYKSNKGREYLSKIIEITQPDAFDFYYNRMKKFTLLRMYENLGVKLDDLYDPNCLELRKVAKQEERLNAMSLEDIAAFVNDKIELIKMTYAQNIEEDFEKAGDGALDILNAFRETPDVGVPLYGSYMNTIHRGARLKKFYLRSAATNVGKSRSMVADSCYVSCSEMYDLREEKWVGIGTTEPTLYISTEQDKSEITTMQLSFLSGVNEEHIVKGEYMNGEWERVIKAAEVLNKSKLIFKTLPDYSMKDLEGMIRLAVKKYGIKYVFFDYLHSTTKILAEVSSNSGVKGLREDNILFLISTRLKDLCNELGIFVMSSTQLNGDYRSAKVYDQNLLRGSKAIADKLDVGMIMLDVTAEDLDKLNPIVSKKGCCYPNVKISVYKNRGNKYKDILVWCIANKGICRFEPIFITDYNFEVLDVEDTKINVIPRGEVDVN